MFKSLIVLAALALSTLTQATSLKPCTPTVEAMPTRISCGTDTEYYTIIIHTLMSPLECQGADHYEYHTAYVTVTDKKTGRVIRKLELLNGDFTYTLSPMPGETTFESPALVTRLDRCASPVHGGVSIGN
jgi:hypothetical protein